MAVPHHAVAAVRQLQVLPLGDEGIGFRDKHLGQDSAGAFTRNFGQWIVNRFRLTERDDGVLAGSTAASIRRLQSNVVTQIPA
jgi:hypothetical protein